MTENDQASHPGSNTPPLPSTPTLYKKIIRSFLSCLFVKNSKLWIIIGCDTRVRVETACDMNKDTRTNFLIIILIIYVLDRNSLKK